LSIHSALWARNEIGISNAIYRLGHCASANLLKEQGDYQDQNYVERRTDKPVINLLGIVA
jgi:hypothetical protein